MAFSGYAPPTSSTTYTPNQFFDVVLPNASRGCLRLVGYLIRKTLGWSDENGNPQNPEAHASYRELIENAGISRGALRPAIDEAIEKKYIDCLRFGQPHRPGEEGFSALYSLRWDEREQYVTRIDDFEGFFAGNGNLTHIPNDFFDYTIPTEPLALVQVVGVIIRHTIGFQTKYGFRRQQVSMSFTDIMRRTGIGSRATVSKALSEAVERNHIRKVSEGVFGNEVGTATVYGVCWSTGDGESTSLPVVEPETEDGSKSEPGEAFKNCTKDLGTVQKVNQAIGSKSEPENGSESVPGTVQKVNREAFKNCTSIETTRLNNTSKQQQTEAAAEENMVFDLLVKEGFDKTAAIELSKASSEENIRNQIRWIDSRGSSKNKLGMLRKSILGEWGEPESVQTSEQAVAFVREFYSAMRGAETVVKPTVSEIGQASEILSKAGEDCSGSEFGRYVRSALKLKNREHEGTTFSYAARGYADTFLSHRRARAQASARVTSQNSKANHRKRFEKDYSQFCLKLALQIESGDASLAQAIENALMVKLEKRKRVSDRAFRMTQEQLESADGRASLVWEVICEQYPERVIEFWDWDKKHNATPFEEPGE